MGFIRGVLIVIASVLLFVSLLATGFFITVTFSLSYDSVQSQVHPIVVQIIEEQIGEITILDTLTPYLDGYCEENSEVVQDFEGYTFVFPCETIKLGKETLVEYSVNYLIEDFYYKEYSCEFWKCFEESDIPLFLISKYAQEYWRTLFFKFFLFSLILSAGVILLSKRKSKGFFLTGILLILTSLIILKLETIGTFIAKLIISPISMALTEETTSAVLSQVVGIFFSKSGTIFVWMFVIALILIGIGILLKLFKIGFKISNFFKKIEETAEKEDKKEKTTKEIKDKKSEKKDKQIENKKEFKSIKEVKKAQKFKKK